MMKLDGKVVVITGASSGIGEATAEALAAEGAIVVAAARREERLEDLKQRVEARGTRVMTVQCDVTDEQQAHDLIRKANQEFGHVDILVNNAGVMLLSKIEKGLSDQWRQMNDVNVLGLLYVTNAAIEVMKRQGSGHIVNISSVAGRRSNPTTESTPEPSTPSTPSQRHCEESWWKTAFG
jgi:NADP-dependent 3-hydroxy acid dehydrogenase YdfG